MEQGWKRTFLYNWYNVSVAIAGLLAVVLAIGDWDVRQRMLLGSSVVIFLHFFEEFAFPGGFAPMGIRVELRITDPDAHQWPLNQLNSMVGNWLFAVLVYLLPLFLPNVKFLTLAAAVFCFAEVLMHAVVFNIATKRWYNPGLATAVCGLLPISVWYFSNIWGQHLYSGVDIALALVWILFNYWLGFRGPLYKKLGAMSDRYAFTPEEVAKGAKYLK
ncbi:MAG: HXXEE domain-containing protein [Candidatus Onthomonas sp.]